MFDVAEHLRAFGWHCDIVDARIVFGPSFAETTVEQKQPLVRDYLRLHAAEYDIVELEPGLLPYSRSEFPARPLIVARSVLLATHLEHIRFPTPRSFKYLIRLPLSVWRNRRILRQTLPSYLLSLRESDLINVTSTEDRFDLVSRGISPDKIGIFPYGISDADIAMLGALRKPAQARPPTILFLGTLDWRKGGADLPPMFSRIMDLVPDAQFVLAGAKSIFRDTRSMLEIFPPTLRPSLKVIERYERHQLPGILSESDVGVFPSYLEGCPFSVMEQMLGGVPVIAYDSPGNGTRLPVDWLVPCGNWRMMADRIIQWLQRPTERLAAEMLQRTCAQEFTWKSVARSTHEWYSQKLAQLRPT